ncbi:MAG: SpoIID/LytB domain-containing protein, partial [Acidimicrobiales bacterium]
MHAQKLGSSRRLRGMAKIAVLIAAGLVSCAPALVSPSTAAASTNPFPTGNVTIEGHGWGPGVGMGQWGAFGYAAVKHEPYQWILSHFYGGTTLSTTKNPQISVSILENEAPSGTNDPVVVTSASRFRFGGIFMPPGTAAEAVISSTGSWTLYQAPSCSASASGWTPVKGGSGLVNPIAVPISQRPNAPSEDLLTICRADGVNETVRGIVKAYNYDNANTGNVPLARTLNILPLNEYLADVVPSESSAGWGMVGGKNPADGKQWGFQELEAQAVAARTYVLAYIHAGGWHGYASICDSYYCQSYPGITNESAIATQAVNDTTGQYLTIGGQPAPTQYSASTGGYTVASSFPAVIDAGDAVCLKNTSYWTCNNEHTWSASIPVKTVESTFPTIGTLESVTATSRNGLGQWGGRVLTIRIAGSLGAVTESGSTFKYQFGLDSDW